MSVVIFFDVLLHYVKMLFTLSKSLVLCISDVDVSFKRGTHVHGKTTYEWHMDDIRVHMSDIRMTCKHKDDIRVHTSDMPLYIGAYGWLTDNMRVQTSDILMAYDYIQILYEHIRMTYEWHTSDIRMTYE